MPAPTITDLFGAGAVYSGGALSVPRANLKGFSPSSGNKTGALAALLLVLLEYFEGEISDWDGEVITDDENNTLGYSQNRAEATLTGEFVVKNVSLDDNKVFWDYLVATYTQQDPEF